MNPILKALRPGLLLAALATFTAVALATASDAIPDPTPTPATPLHEIGSLSSLAPTPTPTASPHHLHDDDDNRVRFGEATYVGPNETISGNAVAITGPLTVDGVVEGNGVAVVGSTTINGTVHGNAVAVLGNLRLGPNARVDGNAVAVGGRVFKDPTATVGGNVVPVTVGGNIYESEEASSFWNHGIRMGRPLAFGPHLHLLWIANIFLVACYLLLALIFPGGIARCVDTLEKRPGATLLTGFLSFLGLPVLFILLLITVVGIPVAILLLPLAIFAALLFGKTAIYSIVGRAIVGKQSHLVLAVLVGVLVVLGLMLVPFFGFAVFFLVAFLGYSCALTTLFTAGRTAPAVAVPLAAAPLVAPTAVAVAVAPQPPLVEPALPPIEGAVPPVVLAAAVPPAPPIGLVAEVGLARAGFWVRMVALMIDALLVGILTHMSDFFLPALALYGALLWKYRGATIGGIIFGLKVVRLDGRPSDWATVSVRALACFFSLLCLGLGFLWIAFDREKQGWHDKIAGTVVVRLPKGVSLV